MITSGQGATTGTGVVPLTMIHHHVRTGSNAPVETNADYFTDPSQEHTETDDLGQAATPSTDVAGTI